MVLDVIIFALFIWAVYVDFTDKSGWSGLITIPILLLVAILSIGAAIALIVAAVRSSTRKHRYAYLLGALITLLPIIVAGTYIFIGTQLDQQANDRANTPVSLSQARKLVETCQVETIMRQGGGSMQLNAYAPAVPGTKDIRRESRTFDVKYYDELLNLARRKDVEDRCGFVPTYDIERPRQPEVKKWITQAEAETIMNKCLWNTQFNTDSRYLTEADYPAGIMTTGILLKQSLSVWNDDTESAITLVKIDDQTRTALQEKQKTCWSRQFAH
jgi:hypothetical protein